MQGTRTMQELWTQDTLPDTCKRWRLFVLSSLLICSKHLCHPNWQWLEGRPQTKFTFADSTGAEVMFGHHLEAIAKMLLLISFRLHITAQAIIASSGLRLLRSAAEPSMSFLYQSLLVTGVALVEE